MESKKINQLATELAPELSDLTIIGDPTTGISKKITLSQMASLFTGTVEEYANLASFPLVGTADTIYIALDTNIIYRWNTGTSAYVELSPNIVTSLVFNDANGFDGTISLVGSTATLTITTALTTGSVGFIGASGALLEDNTNFFWNNSTKRLGINTNVPTTALDVFGSGIIGRLNGTSTNNAYLGFASAGTNKWSIGNVQSDHRFRIYSEANAAELVSVLQTGEVGIGIANPLTKLHIFGGASALIANLDANTSVAKSISFRSGNSSRINLEVSGTESGSNAGMDLFIRRYSDAGALIDTPFTITRSTGLITIPNLSFTNLTGTVNVPNGGTGATTFTSGRILFGNGTSALNTSANLFWDNTNSRLGLGTITPASKLEIVSTNQGNSVVYGSIFNITTSTAINDRLNINFSQNGNQDRARAAIGAVAELANGLASSLAFYTRNAQDSSGLAITDEKMRIDSSGNVGINATTISQPSTGAITLRIVGTQTTKGGSIYLDSSDSSVQTYLYADNASGLSINTSTSHHIVLRTNGNERMRILSSGNISIGSIDDIAKLYVNGTFNATTTLTSGYAHTLSNQSTAAGASGLFLDLYSSSTSSFAFAIRTNNGNTYALRVRADGQILTNSSVYANTTATAANMFLFGATGYDIGRSTSSVRFKTQIEDIEEEYVNNIFKMKPKWYRSLCERDNKDWSHFGFIAEEMAEIEPRLVHWFEEEDGTYRADGVQYDRITALLVKVVQKQQAEIELLKAK